MSKRNVVPEITSLDLLRSFYAELSAAPQRYYKRIVRVLWPDGEQTESTIVGSDGPPAEPDRSRFRGSRRVETARDFVEVTAGSLYTPISNLGYKGFDFEAALNFKIDCDLARKKTGNIDDGAVHYISNLAAGEYVFRRREFLEDYTKRKRTGNSGFISEVAPNSEDIRRRYLAKNNALSKQDRKAIEKWLAENKKILDRADDFKHDDYRPQVIYRSVSISGGPDDLDEESFLEWLISQDGDTARRPPKPTQE